MKHHPTFASMLRDRATQHPERTAIIFVADDGTETALAFHELWRRSLAVAGALIEQTQAVSPQATPAHSGSPSTNHDAAARLANEPVGPRALMMFPPGIDFLPALIGAQIANWVAVPLPYPKPHREMPRLNAAARDCSASIILSDSNTIATLDRSHLDPAADVPCLAVDRLWSKAGNGDLSPEAQSQFETLLAASGPESIAFLQYTSGSTSSPKGVIVSQRNLMSNLEAIRTGFGLPWVNGNEPKVTTSVFWLPYYHDMGLVGGVLAPLYIGFRTVLMSPQSFVRQPIRWLKAVEQYQAAVTGGPNFAFELCADRISPAQAQDLDLSSLKVMFCGAEPIRAAALQAFESRFAPAGFSADCYYPCYGLAESTLLAAGGRGPSRPTMLQVDRDSLSAGNIRVASSRTSDKVATLVSCGQAAGDSELVIVDPVALTLRPEREIGEIWLRGPSVTAGYWNRIDTDQILNARFSRRRGTLLTLLGSADRLSEDVYFRTGDLGFIHHGDLFVTGRIKELIIIRGRNYFPQDIESHVRSVATLAVNKVAALSTQGPRGESLAVVAELPRHASKRDCEVAVREIRREIIAAFEIDAREIVFVAPASIPVTTSGKLQRNACRNWLTPHSPPVVHRWRRNSGTESPPLTLPTLPDPVGEHDFACVRELVCEWIIQWLIVRGGIDADQINVNRRFEDYGLDSLMAIELVGDLEDSCDVELTPMLAWEHPTIIKMASLIARSHGDRASNHLGESSRFPSLVSAGR